MWWIIAACAVSKGGQTELPSLSDDQLRAITAFILNPWVWIMCAVMFGPFIYETVCR
jgi:hypothetical protein